CWVTLIGWSLMGDAVSHAVLPGVVLSYLLGLPFAVGALVFGVGSVALIGAVNRTSRVKEDAAIGIVFTAMFALGIVVISRISSDTDLRHILFGDPLGVSDTEIVQIVVMTVVALTVVAFKHRDLTLYAFDPTHAHAIGLRPRRLDTLLLGLLAVTVVIALQVLGIIMVVAMLIIPGATAYLLTDRFERMVLIAVAVSVTASVVGVYASFLLDVAPGGMIVLVQALAFTAAYLLAPRHGLLARRAAPRRAAPRRAAARGAAGPDRAGGHRGGTGPAPAGPSPGATPRRTGGRWTPRRPAPGRIVAVNHDARQPPRAEPGGTGMADEVVGVVGAGIVGLAVGREIARRRPGTRVVVLEKEDRVAAHQSSHNSGVVHAGLYYRPGSLKARLCTRGRQLLRAYCTDRGLPYQECGKLVVALTPEDVGRLDDLYARADRNAVPGLRRVGPAEIRDLEPHCTGLAALHSPHTAITDYPRICGAFAADVAAAGGEIRFGAPVTRIRETGE